MNQKIKNKISRRVDVWFLFIIIIIMYKMISKDKGKKVLSGWVNIGQVVVFETLHLIQIKKKILLTIPINGFQFCILVILVLILNQHFPTLQQALFLGFYNIFYFSFFYYWNYLLSKHPLFFIISITVVNSWTSCATSLMLSQQ